MARTVVRIDDHVAPIIAYLDAGLAFPVVEWTRPDSGDPNYKYLDPPFASVRPFPSAEEFGGPLSDSQADINLRYQVVGTGKTPQQARVITDRVRDLFLNRNAIRSLVPKRKVMNVKHMVVHSGMTRENDTVLPWYYSIDLYEVMTTPDPAN